MSDVCPPTATVPEVMNHIVLNSEVLAKGKAIEHY